MTADVKADVAAKRRDKEQNDADGEYLEPDKIHDDTDFDSLATSSKQGDLENKHGSSNAQKAVRGGRHAKGPLKIKTSGRARKPAPVVTTSRRLSTKESKFCFPLDLNDIDVPDRIRFLKRSHGFLYLRPVVDDTAVV